MKAARYHRHGGTEILQFDDVPVPEPEAGEVQIHVAGFGVIPFDWKLMEGRYSGGATLTSPGIFGHEVAGVVTKLGDGVTQFEVGDAVMGQTRKGAAAEFATLPATAAAKAPPSLELAEAAGLVVNGLTANQALNRAGVSRGKRVLIHGGAGGVGHMAIQLAKWSGAWVAATGSASGAHFMAELGADQTIDYRSAPFEDQVDDIDIVLDTIGGETQTRSKAVMKPGGVLATLTGVVAEGEFERAGFRIIPFSMTPTTEELAFLAGLVEDLKLDLIVTVELPFDRLGEAVEESRAGHTRGKIIVRVPA
jgi:NADPH:quinone reductase-like Zn-dependent oxidoreductase